MLRTLILAAAGLSLAACASGPTYKAASSDRDTGYAERAIESDRYLVSFRGDNYTPKADVETFLLYRAAELTLERGFDHFIVLDRDTESKSKLRADNFGPYHSRWNVRYSYFHPRFGWYGAYDPFWNSGPDYTEITRYEASAEIVMRAGDKPKDEPRAFDARDVAANLRDKVLEPQ